MKKNARSRTVTERNQRKIFENYKNFLYNIYVRKINYNKKKESNSMYTKNDIMARLQKGDDPQAIANEIADTLNAALKEYEESKAEVAKKEAAEKKDAEKQKDMTELCNMFNAYMHKYYDWDEGTFDEDDVREVMEVTEAAMLAATELKDMLNDLAKKLDEDMDEQPARLHHETTPNTKCACKEHQSQQKQKTSDLDAELHKLLKELFN